MLAELWYNGSRAVVFRFDPRPDPTPASHSHGKPSSGPTADRLTRARERPCSVAIIPESCCAFALSDTFTCRSGPSSRQLEGVAITMIFSRRLPLGLH